MTTIPTIEALNKMIETGLDMGLGYFGIRALYSNEPIEIGAYLNNSFDWVDGEQTEVELPGTCAIGIKTSFGEVNEQSVGRALMLVAKFSSSGRFALIGGRGHEYGIKDGEVILRDARILGIW